ncbi:pre-peptidase C-terminal domain-containing protein [Marinovum sp.]|uniref:pre-peptidase C-terminal domain-containing protein n=1 Tax=Marinovum sp. TaxID=2024839 RepID=UPI003A953336
MADDYPANSTTTATVQVNGSRSARIDNGVTGDQDWFRVTLTAGTKYRIDAEGASLGANTHIAGIYDAAGTLISGTTNYNGGIGQDARVWFVAPTSGEYFISAGGNPGQTTTSNKHYNLWVRDDWDVGPGDISTPFTLTPGGGPLVATIDESIDTDWYAITLAAGEQVGFIATGGTSTYYAGGTFNTDVQIGGIYDDSGTAIAGTMVSNPGRTQEQLFFTAPTAGTYYVEIAGEGTASEGRYTIEARSDDLAGGIETTGIVVGDDDYASRTGVIFAGDEDWIVTPLKAGETYEISVTGRSVSGTLPLGDPKLAGLYDPAGTLIAGTTASGSGPTATLVYTPTADGSYFAAITGETDSDSGGYRLVVHRDEASADITTTADALVITGAYSNGTRLHAGDTDWLPVTLQAGKTYEFDFRGEGGFDAKIAGLHDPAGALIAGTEASAGPISFSATADGTYFLAMAAEDGVMAGNVQIKVTVDDYTADITTTGRVDVNGITTGELEAPGDHDWIGVDLTAGETYRIEYRGLNTGEGTLYDPDPGGIYDSAGAFISGSAGDVGGAVYDVLSYFTAPATDRYYLSIFSDGSGPSGANLGSYTVEVTSLADDFAGDTSTTGTLAVGGTSTGNLSTGDDTDWFAVTLEAGESYRARLEGSGSSPLRYEAISVFDDSGSSLGVQGHGTYGGAAQVTFTAQQAGTYFIEAASPYSGFSYSGDYTLSLTQLVTMTGGDGADWITLPATGGLGLAAIIGGTGVDMVSFSGLDTGVTVNLHSDLVQAGGSAPFAIVMSSIENVTGTSHDDVFYGSDRSEKVRGLGGRDLFHGSDGERDTIDGGSSTDTISYINSSEGVSVSLLRGRGWGGDADGDRITDVENIIGSRHDDMIWGDALANRLEGQHGDDTIVGGGGDDYISAGLGTDVIVFSGNRADYDVVHSGIRTEVTHLNGGYDGFDVIGHAEVLRFADGDMTL